MSRAEWERQNQADQDRFDRYGYPDPPWLEAQREAREEDEAWVRESRYFDAPARVSDDWTDDDLEEAA